MATLNWQYAPSIAASTRGLALLSPPTFESLVEAIASEMRVLCGHEDPCKDNSDFQRATYTVNVPPPLFDLMFNSANGYRAWYFRSPYKGVEKNAALIAALAPALLAANPLVSMESRTAESLRTLSAKVWLAEAGREPDKKCEGCKGEWTHPQDDEAELLNGRWELSNDKRGRRAPYLSKFVVFGAFLNANCDVFVPERKRFRARHIHESGWS